MIGEPFPNLPGGKSSSRYYIKVLGKALRVMETLRQDKVGLRLSEIVGAVQMDKATPLRILYTLRREGGVSREPRTKKLKLPFGSRKFRVGYAQTYSGKPFSEAVTRGLPTRPRSLRRSSYCRQPLRRG